MQRFTHELFKLSTLFYAQCMLNSIHNHAEFEVINPENSAKCCKREKREGFDKSFMQCFVIWWENTKSVDTLASHHQCNHACALFEQYSIYYFRKLCTSCGGYSICAIREYTSRNEISRCGSRCLCHIFNIHKVEELNNNITGVMLSAKDAQVKPKNLHLEITFW